MNQSPLTDIEARNAGTQTLHRAVLLLRFIAANNRLGLRLVDLYRGTNTERPTAYRILQGLIGERLVRQDAKTKRYFLSSLMYEMGLAAAPKLALRDICRPRLQLLADQTEDTVFLTMRSGFDGVCIDRVEGNYPVKVFVLEVGRRRPLTVGGGSLAILFAMDDDEINRICMANAKRTQEKYPRYSEESLRTHIGQSRRRGYVVKEVIEVPEVVTVAMPIRNAAGIPIAAISLAALKTRLRPERIESIAALMGEAVAQIQETIHSLDDTDDSATDWSALP